MNTYTEKLFSYGTLQYENVQLETFGRKLSGTPDVLVGYRIATLTISDPNVVATSGEAIHPVLIPSHDKNDEVKGMVFAITPEELAQADSYEAADYQRMSAQLRSGIHAWVYVGR